MRQSPLSVLGLFLLAGLSSDALLGEEVDELSVGEPLYFAYQGKWFEALERLNASLYGDRGIEGPGREAFWYETVDENFSVGDFELNYRMDHKAALS